MLDNVINEPSRLIVLLDKKNKVHFINDAAYSIFGIECGETFPEKGYAPIKTLRPAFI